jgi:membrane-bound lytic murein transglycosylase F
MSRSRAATALSVLLLLAAPGCRAGGDRDDGAAAAGETASKDASAEAAAPADAPGITHVSARRADLPRHTDDLDTIAGRGILRVLVASAEEAFLPRAGTPASHDRAMVREFADRRGLEVQFILVAEHDQLIPMLLEGVGDVAAAQLTVTDARQAQVAFTWPLHTVEEIVVGRRGAEGLPEKPEDLAGREVHVRAGSAYAETLTALAGEKAEGLKLVPVEEHLDTETIVYEVTAGRRPLTVVDSHLLTAVEAYNEDVARLFAIRDGRDIAWAVRPDNPDLKAALDAFLIEKALTAHTEARFTGDLDGIKERGRLRVLTRNNPVTYFLHRGRPMGFDYEMAQMIADALDVRLEMVVPPSRDQLVPWLLEGRGDLIAASMTITPERSEQVAFSRPYLLVDEVLVGPADGPAIGALADLAGKTVHVRASSSYYATLQALSERIEGLTIVAAPEDLETERLIDLVARGEIPLTVADTHILQVELTYRDDVRPLLVLTGEAGAEPPEAAQVGVTGTKEIAFAVRPDSEALKDFLDGFVRRTYRGLEYNMARRRYFQHHRRIAGAGSDRPGEGGRLSPFDALIQRFSRQYGLDWRLMAALAYQESRFDPNAESWVGAQGLFQVMPATGEMLGFRNLRDPEEGTHAGIMYMHRRISRLDSRIPFDERVRFALAGYNCGIGHVGDARRLAASKGWDPDKWFDNVERAMLLLMQPRYHRQARHGYVRGTEPVNYVSSIQNRYDNYVQIVPQDPGGGGVAANE